MKDPKFSTIAERCFHRRIGPGWVQWWIGLWTTAMQEKQPGVDMVNKRKGGLLTLRLFSLSVSSPRLAKINRHSTSCLLLTAIYPSVRSLDFVLCWPKPKTVYIFKFPLFPSHPQVNGPCFFVSLYTPITFASLLIWINMGQGPLFGVLVLFLDISHL